MTTLMTMNTSAFPSAAGSESRPPRYSTLPGSISESAAERLRTITNTAALIAAHDPARELELSDRRPPRYNTVFREQSPRGSTETSRSAPRRRGGSLSVGVPKGSSDLAGERVLTPGSSAPMEFAHHIQSGYAAGRSTPWATLKLFSLSSVSPGPGAPHGTPKLPKYTSNELIQGCLEINLENPQSINSISLAVSIL